MSYVAAVQTAYDTVAATYADRYGDALAGLPLSRAMLAAFADLLAEAGLVVLARLVEEPDAGQRHQSATLLARRDDSDG